MDRRGLLIISLTVLGVIIIMYGIAPGMGTSPKLPKISIEGAEAKLSPTIVGTGSVFMKIVNSGDGDDNLLNARVSIPNTVVEMHDIKDGKMIKIDKIHIPANTAVELKPKGLHIMIFKMPRDIKEGHEFTLYLTFEKSGERQITVKLVKGGAEQMHHRH